MLSADFSDVLLEFHWKRLQRWVSWTCRDAGEPFSGREGELEEGDKGGIRVHIAGVRCELNVTFPS